MDLTLKQYELFKRNLYLYNEIDDLTSQDFIKDSNELIYTDKEIYQSNLFNIKQLYPDIDIAEKHPEINIYLNSFGGACYPGLSIYDNIIQLNKHAKTNIIASGSCMSMALIILLAVPLEQRKCLKNTTFLIHQVSGISIGKLSDMENQTNEIKRLNNILFNIITENTSITIEQLKENYNTKEDWIINAEDALKLKIISEIL